MKCQYKLYLREPYNEVPETPERLLRRLTDAASTTAITSERDDFADSSADHHQPEIVQNAEESEIMDVHGSDLSDRDANKDFNMINDSIDSSISDPDNFSKRRNPKSLQDYIKSEEFAKKIETPVTITTGELFLMILKFSLANSLSTEALSNLFKLINSIFVEPILPNSRYLIDKLLNAEKDAEFHATCDGCSAYVGKFPDVKDVVLCTTPTCNRDLDLKNQSRLNYFVLLDPSTQISSLLNTYEDHYNFIMNNRVSKLDCVEDIYDGKRYLEFVNNLGESEKKNYVTLIFNTDGAPKFECSNSSIYPMYLMLNEIPAQSRLDNLIVCGLWFNKMKPNLSIVLTQLVNFINNLTTNGIKCIVKGRELVVKPYILVSCVDSVARAPMQGIKQFNGNFGCNWCLHPGEWADRSMRYPYRGINIVNRDHHSTVHDMLHSSPDISINGIRYPSPFINLPSFDIIWGFTLDYLHCCLEGVAKQIIEYLLEPLNYTDLQILDKKLISISVANQISRLTRPLSERNNWKAREWGNFILYYSIPLLESKLDKRKLRYWRLFVESLFILLQDCISIENIHKAHSMLHKFVELTENLFKIKAMTYNVHQLLHIANSVLNWGPLWAQSTFPFESANFYLLRAIKCAKGVPQQILRFVHINHCTLVLEECVPRRFSNVINTYDNVLKRKVKNVTQIGNITYIGKGREIDYRIVENLDASTILFYKRVVKDGCLYTGNYERNRRSNNSFAKLKNGKFIKIINFCIDNDNQQFTLCQLVHTEALFPSSTNTVMKLIDLEEDIASVMTSDIIKICVYIKILNEKYLCVTPNLLHY